MIKPILLFSASCILLLSCAGDHSDDGAPGSGSKDTVPGVVTTPPHDTSSVITPPPTNDRNAVSTDSQGSSR